MKIARQFIAGNGARSRFSPGGTLDLLLAYFSRPSGTGTLRSPEFPPMKRWAIVSGPSGTKNLPLCRAVQFFYSTNGANHISPG